MIGEFVGNLGGFFGMGEVAHALEQAHGNARRAARTAGDFGATRRRDGSLHHASSAVDHGFEIEAGSAVQCGQIIGWVEGFKAISDLFCVVEGQFVGPNTALKENIRLISKEPFGGGWLYEAAGRPDAKCLDVHSYRDLLDKAIDRILAQQKGDEKE